jgi:hypothetical protein
MEPLLNQRKHAFVKVGDFYFQIVPHKAVEQGSLAFNGIQRRCIGASAGEKVTVRNFLPRSIGAYSMKLSITKVFDFGPNHPSPKSIKSKKQVQEPQLASFRFRLTHDLSCSWIKNATKPQLIPTNWRKVS